MHYHVEPIPAALEIVAFTCHHLALGLPVLLVECRLLTVDPVEAGHNGQPNGFIIQTQRRGDAYPAAGRIDTDMEVLDILADDLDWDTADQNASALSSHAAPSRS